uniref:Uncharacterized protein n=1 Tax=Pararge aegeria TaxID=116150 RepID=S4P146_9NEOP
MKNSVLFNPYPCLLCSKCVCVFVWFVNYCTNFDKIWNIHTVNSRVFFYHRACLGKYYSHVYFKKCCCVYRRWYSTYHLLGPSINTIKKHT